MKHPNFPLLPLLFAVALLSAPLHAQKRRSTASKPKAPAPTALQQAREAMSAYDFDHAAEILTKAIAEQQRKRKPTLDLDSLEALLEFAQRVGTKLHATERIVVIDSVVCEKEKALKAIRLTRESGRLDTYASTYHTRDTLGAIIYENELANKRYLALPDSALRLAVSDKIGDHWSAPTLLSGLGEDDTAQNFPFLLSDGVTLYYAATGPESIGGYDIFVTRADGEDGSFLAPENVGFPFNSPANDYLLAIDELAQLGWFVTDRRQPKGKVCVYTFIPNDTREVYGDETSDERLRALARLTSIRDTWNDAPVKEARQRLAGIRAGKNFGKPAPTPASPNSARPPHARRCSATSSSGKPRRPMPPCSSACATTTPPQAPHSAFSSQHPYSASRPPTTPSSSSSSSWPRKSETPKSLINKTDQL